MNARLRASSLLVLVLALAASVPSRADQPLGARLPDAAFWKIITDFSETWQA